MTPYDYIQLPYGSQLHGVIITPYCYGSYDSTWILLLLIATYDIQWLPVALSESIKSIKIAPPPFFGASLVLTFGHFI